MNLRSESDLGGHDDCGSCAYTSLEPKDLLHWLSSAGCSKSRCTFRHQIWALCQSTHCVDLQNASQVDVLARYDQLLLVSGWSVLGDHVSPQLWAIQQPRLDVQTPCPTPCHASCAIRPLQASLFLAYTHQVVYVLCRYSFEYHTSCNKLCRHLRAN